MASCHLNNADDLYLTVGDREVQLKGTWLTDMNISLGRATSEMTMFGNALQHYMAPQALKVTLELTVTDVKDVTDPEHPKKLGRYELARRSR